jgi:hypothetical protein
MPVRARPEQVLGEVGRVFGDGAGFGEPLLGDHRKPAGDRRLFPPTARLRVRHGDRDRDSRPCSSETKYENENDSCFCPRRWDHGRDSRLFWAAIIR